MVGYLVGEGILVSSLAGEGIIFLGCLAGEGTSFLWYLSLSFGVYFFFSSLFLALSYYSFLDCRLGFLVGSH